MYKNIFQCNFYVICSSGPIKCDSVLLLTENINMDDVRHWEESISVRWVCLYNNSIDLYGSFLVSAAHS